MHRKGEEARFTVGMRNTHLLNGISGLFFCTDLILISLIVQAPAVNVGTELQQVLAGFTGQIQLKRIKLDF